MRKSARPSLFRQTRIILWLLVFVAVGVFAWVRFASPDKAELAGAGIGGPFALTGHNGEIVRDSDFEGKIRLIYFGFTYCPDICPASLQTIAIALDKLDPIQRKQIQPLFITVDPERDTPEVLKNHVEYFVPGMIGLTGTPEEIQEVANAYRVAYWKDEDPESALEYTMNHASLFLIMGPSGEYVTALPTEPGPGVRPNSVGTPDNLARELAEALRS